MTSKLLAIVASASEVAGLLMVAAVSNSIQMTSPRRNTAAAVSWSNGNDMRTVGPILVTVGVNPVCTLAAAPSACSPAAGSSTPCAAASPASPAPSAASASCIAASLAAIAAGIPTSGVTSMSMMNWRFDVS